MGVLLPLFRQPQIWLRGRPVRDLRFMLGTLAQGQPQGNRVSRERKRFPSTKNISRADRKVKVRQFRPMADMWRLSCGVLGRYREQATDHLKFSCAILAW